MEKFTIVAWLPGTNNVALRGLDGSVGYWSPYNGYDPQFPSFIDAAVHKYGYRMVPEQQISIQDLPAWVKEMNASLDR